jgi:predicted nuclease with TOPRIM domain
MEADVANMRELCHEKLPAELEERRLKIDMLRRSTQLGSVGDAFNNIENDIRRLKEDISLLQDKLTQKSESAYALIFHINHVDQKAILQKVDLHHSQR